jgi:toxin ParE1/3/4
MPKPKFSFSEKALEDLADIWEYTFYNWSENQAEIYYRKLIETCKTISNQPSIGQIYPKIASGIFGFKSGKHIIFYQSIDKKDVLIIRILHERLDLKSKFYPQD